jgi:outer membrane protein
MVSVRYEAGGALKSDVLSLKVALARAEEDLIRARNNYTLSVSSLANLLGLDPDTPISLAGWTTGSHKSAGVPMKKHW